MRSRSLLSIVFTVLSLLVVSIKCDSDDSPCSVLGLESRYDVIVVGSGPGGSVSARRLAEYIGTGGKTLSVLLVERGEPYADCAACQDRDSPNSPSADPGTGPHFPSVPQVHIPGSPTFSYKDVAVQGGSSSVNGMVWIRPNGHYYFNTFFPHNWDWKTMIPYFIKVENYTFPDGYYHDNEFNYTRHLRGNQGLVTSTQNTPSDKDFLGKRLIEAVPQVWPHIFPVIFNGSMNNNFFNGRGVSPGEQSVKDGKRQNSYITYIDTFTGSNLRSVTRVRVNKINFHRTRVTGVELVFVNEGLVANSTTCVVNSSSIISSAGSFGTPKLLKLSGVGPRAELESLGIPVVVDNPEVGANFDDQFGVLLEFTNQNPDSTYIDIGRISFNTQDNAHLPTNFFFEVDAASFGGTPVVTFDSQIAFAESRGTVTINTTNPDFPPVLDPNFLATENDRNNLAVLLNQTIHLQKVMNLTLSIPDPCLSVGADCSTLCGQLEAYLSTPGLPFQGNHFTGTSALGRVVSPYTSRVYGTTGLYVVDLSIAARAPAHNTQYLTYALSERAIELVIADLQNRGIA